MTWLNEGIKTLRIDTILPNQGVQDIIKAVNLNDLQLTFTPDTAFNPSASSRATTANFGLPFKFPIDIVEIEQTIDVSFNGQDLARLNIPRGPSNTDVAQRIIHINFNNIPFAVFGDKHSQFSDFLKAATINNEVQVTLSGTASAQAKTAVGTIGLSGIQFNVPSKLNGK